ncbi:MAG TPA: AAA family ATPase [Polyangiaceae bacterium]|nr:AAA family ATPase [Polyangiaceae bacterium]
MGTSAVLYPPPASGKVGDVYRDILEWSASLPAWQNELLRRVLRSKDLALEEINELAAAAVAENELQTSTYALLSASDLPAVAASTEHRRLLALKEVRNVNALRADQTLTFGPQLTVVYGDNAAGKSGYCRVLKKVYRARVVDDILGDVRSEAPPTSAAAATFVVKTAQGEELTVQWVDESPAVHAGRFAVLDSACSATYVRGGTLAVGPAGIDVLDRFAVELDRAKRQLAGRAISVQPSKKTLQHLENDTEAGRFVRSLSALTSDSEIGAMAAWGPGQDLALQRLDAAVASGKSSAPSARRLELAAGNQAMRALSGRFAAWAEHVSTDAVAELKRAVVDLSDAEAALGAARSIGDENVSSDRLKSNAWVELVRAAARFVQSVDGPTETAMLSLDGRCVLCWQRLDEQTRSRLDRFQRHVEGAAQKAKEEAQRRYDELVSRIKAEPPALSAQDEALVAQVEGLAARLRLLAADIMSRREAILGALNSAEWPLIVAVDSAALDEVRALSAQMEAEGAALPATDALANEQLAALEQQRGALASRKALAQSADAVREFVKSTLEYQRLSNAEGAVNTRAASNKAKELHAKHMTERYARLVDEELRGLCFRRQKPVLSQKTDKAKVEVKPLVSAEMKHLSAEKVFSEGERTAIALACFLAELRLGNDPSGLIFDDPVSSLDHNVREHVARRLVAAAKERQVIVFTHDLAFLADLREQAEKIQNVDCEFRTLTATEHAVGVVEEEEPFGARSINKRIGVLKTILVQAETASKRAEPQALRMHARDFYDRLRSTWERFIEERLFAQVVRRLERNVMPGALSKVIYSHELAEKVHEGWRRCSAVIEAHDHAPAAGQQTYSLEEMKQDLGRLLDAEETAKKAVAA